MKTFICVLTGCILSIMVTAQAVVKGHAWREQTVRGARPTPVAGETGNRSARTAGSGNLYIYIEYKKAQNIVPFRIWIDGKPYRLTYSKQQNTPVLRKTVSADGVGYDNETLVPRTANPVMKISPVQMLTQLTLPEPEAAKEDLENGKIVVEYYWRARRYAFTIPEIKMLPAVRLQ
jgi:hypothetical protein